MSLLGFKVIAGFILLSMFGTTITDNCKSTSEIKVCKGDSKVLTPSANCNINNIHKGISIKLKNSRTGHKWVKVDMTQDVKKYERNSTLVEVKNIGENDTGLYRYRIANSAEKCCVSLAIICEYLVVPSGSSVNLICKVIEDGTELRKGILKMKWKFKNESVDLAYCSNGTNVFLEQLKKINSGNYTCRGEKEKYVLGSSRWKVYTFVLEVYDLEPQLVATTKETSQKKQTSRISLPTTVSVPDCTTRNETTPSTFTVHTDTTKQKATENVPNSTKVKPKKTPDTSSKKKETLVPSTKKVIAVVFKKKGEKDKRPNSVGTRANLGFFALVLCQLYIYGIYTSIAY